MWYIYHFPKELHILHFSHDIFCVVLRLLLYFCRDVDETGLSDKFGWRYGKHFNDGKWYVFLVSRNELPMTCS